VADLLGRDADFSDWWAKTPFRVLLLDVCVPDPRWPAPMKPVVRKSGEDLLVRLVKGRSELPDKRDQDALRDRARTDLHGTLVATAQMRRLDPPPLPDRVTLNGEQWRSSDSVRASPRTGEALRP